MRAEIKKAIKEVAYPEVAEALQVFELEGEPFAIPSVKPQDRSSKKQRIGDLFGGFPFTTDAYPWPTGGVDALHMQPVAQIDLEKASKLLGFDFGEGLLQVWSVVGKSKESLNVIDVAFSSDYSKGVLVRVIPMDETCKAPTDFFPEFTPWIKNPGNLNNSDAVLFIEPNEPMSIGSVINWKLSRELMYPTPHYSLHDIEILVPQPIEKTEDIDPYDLFVELQAAVSYCLKGPNINSGYYLGGVRSYGEGRDSDPAQSFPLLLNIGGDVNLSVILDNTKFQKPDYSSSDSVTLVHFPREKLIKAVYYYAR